MMIRSFRNTDQNDLANLWSVQAPFRGRASRVTPQMLESCVFSKPYFDRDGLLVAEDDSGRIVGFAHAGFGPNESQTDISTEMGVTCLVMVAPDSKDDQLPDRLVAASEQYLTGKGAKLLYAGGVRPLNPYYLGFYGGSELPGILASDTNAVQLFSRCDYKEIDRCVVMECPLGQFRAPVDRRQLQNRRKFRVEFDTALPTRSWWEACTSPPTDVTRFVIFPADGGPPCGSVTFWIIEPLSTSRGKLTAGLTNLHIHGDQKRQGLATFLNSEAMRQLQMNGIDTVEVQTMQSNQAAISLYEKLGFTQVDQGLVMRKEL